MASISGIEVVRISGTRTRLCLTLLPIAKGLVMRLLSDTEVPEWAEGRGLRVDGLAPLSQVEFASTPVERLRIQIPASAIDVVRLAYILVMTGVREYEESQFSGALLWLQRWEIWSESIDQAGFVLLNGVRTISNCASSVHDAPAQQFGPPPRL